MNVNAEVFDIIAGVDQNNTLPIAFLNERNNNEILDTILEEIPEPKGNIEEPL